ncbi:hypothetical protein, conserved [Eimeria acervulina]|uniref:Uncharacterized protein n=1 Tax=Eimeria acervulina TaxID=5801 RepID=U6GCH5_EIMAC|nr:hypothetical protein, conserved [Eimeria acervulina]CDI77242.1 hypothetical protein, conserved [Eimeria acervulina]
MEASERLVFPPYFPIVRKGCERAATELFECLDACTNDGHTEASERAMKEKCNKLLEEYKMCTEKSLMDKRLPPPVVEVGFPPKSL